MAFRKAVGCMVVLLVTFYCLQHQRYTPSLNVFMEEVVGTLMRTLRSPVREKRAAPSNSSGYVVEAVISTADLAALQQRLSALDLPLQINSSDINIISSDITITSSDINVTSIDTTTVCSNTSHCRCAENYAWPFYYCFVYRTCDAIIGNTCGCIRGLPPDGQYCQLNTSAAATDLLDFDVVLRIPVGVLPEPIASSYRTLIETLEGFPLPHPISPRVTVAKLAVTTACALNSTGGLQCKCEQQFAWSCDNCKKYGACTNDTSQPCRCINGVPDGEFCEPMTNVSQCPTPTPVMNTTTPVMSTTTPEITTTTPMMNTTTPMMNTTTPVMNTTTPEITTTTPEITTTTPEITTTTPEITTTTPEITTTTPEITTTTPEITTTTPEITTTTPDITTTTPEITTTTPKIITTTPEITPTPSSPTQEKVLMFTMDRDFDPTFNDNTSSIYRDTKGVIQEQSQEHISNLRSAELIGFRRGSTIAEFVVRAVSIPDSAIEALQSGIFTGLSDRYPMVFDSVVSKHLAFNPPQGIFGRNVIVTCGPPPSSLKLGTDLVAEWKHDGNLVPEDDRHEFSINSNGEATLTVKTVLNADSGSYECRLKKRGAASAFRQRSNEPFRLQPPSPLVQVTPDKTVQCVNGRVVTLSCSVNSPHEVQFRDHPTAGSSRQVTLPVTISESNCETRQFTCEVKNNTSVVKTITLTLSRESFRCNDDVYGVGNEGEESEGPCETDEVGETIAVCLSGTWEKQRDTCILVPIQELLDQSENLNSASLPEFLDRLSEVSLNFTDRVVESPANINATVNILENIALLSFPIEQEPMTNILITVGILTTDDAQVSWQTLNGDDTVKSPATRNSSAGTGSRSSTLLQSVENITRRLTDASFDITTPSILLNKTTFTDTFSADFEFQDSTVQAVLTGSDGGEKSVTFISFASMDNVLPARDINNSSNQVINGRVVLVQSNGIINDASFTFDVVNETLVNPVCVFWNFSLFDGLGGWDSEGCKPLRINDTVTCNCSHLTSFSILMSPYHLNDFILDLMTYIGVGISIASLVICLIIEAVIWRKISKNTTSYLRHVSIVNIAVSLLIANIWFIVGAFISVPDTSNTPPPCTASTFFIHFFYLALFFWMLASALLLLYRTVSVFDGGLSKHTMLAIGFSIGYGAPLIIATITIAVTAPKDEYIRRNGCWLNFEQSKALLAFVIPALLIVVINLVILLVVIYKLVTTRSASNAAQSAERNVLMVIMRSLAVLTPFFGLTWALGVGTMTTPNKGVHGSFAFFNSLQGFFILVFGTLLDKKVRDAMGRSSQSSGTGTRSTSAGNSSTGLGFIRNIFRGGRDGYHVSSGTSGVSQSFTNT